MSLNLVPANPATIDGAADPGAFVLALVEHARTLLEQAKGMEGLAEVVEIKSRGAAIETYTQQKQMGREAELAAAEIVRRAERRIGELVREGQANGEIRREREGGGHLGNEGAQKLSPNGYFIHNKDRSETYAMTDGVTDDQFESALDQAKQQGNLSRSNVVRNIARQKIDAPDPTDKSRAAVAERSARVRQMAGEGSTSGQIANALGLTPEGVKGICVREGIDLPADAVVRGTRRLDSNRIVSETVLSAVVSDELLAAVDYGALDRTELDGWVSSLSASIRSLTTLRNNLRKELTND